MQQLARTTYEPWLTVQETPRIKEYDQGLWVNAFDKRGLTEDVATFDKFMDMLEDCDDVQDVYHNAVVEREDEE